MTKKPGTFKEKDLIEGKDDLYYKKLNEKTNTK